jgi:hypothetical protein
MLSIFHWIHSKEMLGSLKLQVIFGHGMELLGSILDRSRVHKETQDHKASKDQSGHKVLLGLLVLKVCKVFKVQKVILELMVLLVLKVFRVRLVQLVP